MTSSKPLAESRRTDSKRHANRVSTPGSAPAVFPGRNLPNVESRFSWEIPSIALLLVAINLFAYFSVRHDEFVNYDDQQYVTNNVRVQAGLTWQNVRWAFTTGAAANWHPLTWLSHMLDVQLFGLNAGAHHIVSLSFHILNTLLLFGLLRRMTGQPGRSGFVAALFAVHPLHVESVAWISERKDVLSTLFFMLTIWAYVNYVRRPLLKRYLLVFLFLALGLMAKPMLVTVPFVLLLLDYWPLQRVEIPLTGSLPSQLGFLLREKLPLFALAAVSSMVTYVVQARAGTVSALQALPLRVRAANAAVSYMAYIGKMIWPARLAVFYPYSRLLPTWQVLGALLALAGITPAVIRAGQRQPFLPVGWLWYLGTLVPVIGVIQVGDQAMANRYTYIPLIGLFIIVAWGIPALCGGMPSRSLKMGLPALAGLVIAASTITARSQVQYWKSSLALWSHDLLVTSNNYVAHTSMGALLLAQQKPEEAVAQYSDALRINPNFALAHYGLGSAFADQGQIGKALEQFSESLRLDPGLAEAQNSLGSLFADEGNITEAMAHYSEAVRIQPEYPDAQNNLGALFAQQGKTAEAISYYDEALRLKPDFAEAHNNLGMLLAKEGHLGEAIAQYSEALRLKPDFAEAHNQLGNAMEDQGKFSEAIAQYTEALRLKPDFADAQNNFGAVLAEQGRLGEAVAHYTEALRLKPNFASPHEGMGIVLMSQGKFDEAIREFREALRLKPDYVDAHNNLGAVLWAQGKIDEAGKEFSEVLRLKPDQAQAHNNLANVLQRQGRLSEAVGHYSEAVRIMPAYAEAHYNLGQLLSQQGKRDEAARQFQAALQLRPGFQEARRALDNLTGGGKQTGKAAGEVRQRVR